MCRRLTSHESFRAHADKLRKRKKAMRRFIETCSTKRIGAPLFPEEYAEHQPYWNAWVAGR